MQFEAGLRGVDLNLPRDADGEDSPPDLTDDQKRAMQRALEQAQKRKRAEKWPNK